MDNNIVTKIVVMGGFDRYGSRYLSSTEVLDVDTMTWAKHAPLPISVNYNRGVTSLGGPYLGFSIGGHDGTGRSKSNIYGLKSQGKNIFTWEEVHNMSATRRLHSAVNAPKNLLTNC